MTVSPTPYAAPSIVTIVRHRAWELAVYAAMALWALALYVVVRDHYVHYRIGRFDLGNMVQAVWSTAQGRPLEVTDGLAGEQTVRLASHVDPVLSPCFGSPAGIWRRIGRARCSRSRISLTRGRHGPSWIPSTRSASRCRSFSLPCGS